MKKEINDALKSILLFFGGSFVDTEKIYPIRNFLELSVLEMATLGNVAINQKHNGHYSHLIISNLDETERVIFVYHHLFSNDDTKNPIAMFCSRDEVIFEYVHQEKVFITAAEFNGWLGLSMLATAKKFCEGVIEDDLRISENKLIKDIVDYSRNFIV